MYFAAASFSETARRLRKPQLADAFLLSRHPIFSKQLERICALASQPSSAEQVGNLGRSIREAIAPFDVAGLSDPTRHPWYPAMVSDLLRGASKLGSNATEITTMLRKCVLSGD